MSDLRPDEEYDEVDEEVKEIMERNDLDEDDAEEVKKMMEERGVSESDAVEIVRNSVNP